MANQPTVLVTGATGRVGGQLARQLQGSRLAVRALTRDPARASLRLADHVDVVGGDLGRPDSLAGAPDGVDSVFLVFPSVAADTAARAALTNRRACRIWSGRPANTRRRAQADDVMPGTGGGL